MCCGLKILTFAIFRDFGLIAVCFEKFPRGTEVLQCDLGVQTWTNEEIFQ